MGSSMEELERSSYNEKKPSREQDLQRLLGSDHEPECMAMLHQFESAPPSDKTQLLYLLSDLTSYFTENPEKRSVVGGYWAMIKLLAQKKQQILNLTDGYSTWTFEIEPRTYPLTTLFKHDLPYVPWTFLHWVLWVVSASATIACFFFSIFIFYNVVIANKQGVKGFCFTSDDMNEHICIVAIGQGAFGIITVGQFTVGVFNVCQVGIGLLVSLGQVTGSCGISVAQLTCGTWLPAVQLGFGMWRVSYAQAGVSIIDPFLPKRWGGGTFFRSCHIRPHINSTYYSDSGVFTTASKTGQSSAVMV